MENWRNGFWPLTSSAAVERRFRVTSEMLAARRCRMVDETVVKLVF